MSSSLPARDVELNTAEREVCTAENAETRKERRVHSDYDVQIQIMNIFRGVMGFRTRAASAFSALSAVSLLAFSALSAFSAANFSAFAAFSAVNASAFSAAIEHNV